MNDIEKLVAKVQQNLEEKKLEDEKLWSDLWRLCDRKIENTLRYRGAPRNEVDDLKQEVWIKIRKGIHNYQQQNFMGWITAITIHVQHDNHNNNRQNFNRDFVGFAEVSGVGDNESPLFEPEQIDSLYEFYINDTRNAVCSLYINRIGQTKEGLNVDLLSDFTLYVTIKILHDAYGNNANQISNSWLDGMRKILSSLSKNEVIEHPTDYMNNFYLLIDLSDVILPNFVRDCTPVEHHIMYSEGVVRRLSELKQYANMDDERIRRLSKSDFGTNRLKPKKQTQTLLQELEIILGGHDEH